MSTLSRSQADRILSQLMVKWEEDPEYEPNKEEEDFLLDGDPYTYGEDLECSTFTYTD